MSEIDDEVSATVGVWDEDDTIGDEEFFDRVAAHAAAWAKALSELVMDVEVGDIVDVMLEYDAEGVVITVKKGNHELH